MIRYFKTISKTGLFLILVFLISFTLAGIYRLSGGPGPGSTNYVIFGVFYMFIPSVTVVIVKRLFYKENIGKDLLISFKLNRWFLVAWLLIPVIIFATAGVNLLFPWASFSHEMTGLFSRMDGQFTAKDIEQMKSSMESLPIGVLWLSLISGMIAGITVNAVAGFGEELGWRGFLLKAFKDLNFLKASIIIGVIWGIWHAPMILMGHNYPQHPVIGVAMMTVFCMLLSPFLVYVTIRSGSVITAAIMHGTLNGVAGIPLMMIDGGNDLTTGITGLPGFITMFVFLIFLYIYDTRISRKMIFVNRISQYI